MGLAGGVFRLGGALSAAAQQQGDIKKEKNDWHRSSH